MKSEFEGAYNSQDYGLFLTPAEVRGFQREGMHGKGGAYYVNDKEGIEGPCIVGAPKIEIYCIRLFCRMPLNGLVR